MELLKKILDRIDGVNKMDPNVEIWEEKEYPKEYLYSRRMSDMLFEYLENPSSVLQIAARAQHIRRWEIARDLYPMDRRGYLKWRAELKLYHGEIIAKILLEMGINDEKVNEISDLVTKKKLKTDHNTQILEDVVCLVFLKFHFSEFATKHNEDKIISIVQKTWNKMTDKAHEKALTFGLSEADLRIIQSALK